MNYKLIARKWAIEILKILKNSEDKLRYNEIKKKLPRTTPKQLSLCLNDLVYEKIITKEIISTKMPIQCWYSLTNKGNKLMIILEDLEKLK